MRLQNPIAVVAPTADADVLVALARASRPFTAGQLHKVIGKHSPSGIRRVLLRLAREGIVTSESVGNAVAYRFNTEHLTAPAIVELAQLQHTFMDRMRHVMATWDPEPVLAALFGSAARGEMTADSDIDLFLVRPDGLGDDDRARWEEQVMDLQQAAHVWTGNDVRSLEMTESEVLERRHTEPVLSDIRQQGISLYGAPDFWRRTNDTTHS